jgi:hypothetical protein
MFLSERSRDRYGDVQELIGAYLESHRDGGLSARVEPDDYDAIATTCSAFRTALTEDLATRRQRSLLLAIRSRRWHRSRKRQAKRLIERFGEQPLRRPLDEMKLASVEPKPGV